MVSMKLMEILVKLFLPFSHRHSLLEMGQIQFHPGVLLWNLGQPFTFDLGRFFSMKLIISIEISIVDLLSNILAESD